MLTIDNDYHRPFIFSIKHANYNAKSVNWSQQMTSRDNKGWPVTKVSYLVKENLRTQWV